MFIWTSQKLRVTWQNYVSCLWNCGGDNNYVTIKSWQIWNWWKRPFILETTTTTDYREALFSKTDNVLETLFSNTDNRIDDLTALIAKRLIIGDVPDRADQYDCVTLTMIDTLIWINLDPVHCVMSSTPRGGIQNLKPVCTTKVTPCYNTLHNS